MIKRERLGIAFGLSLGLEHRGGPARRAAPRGALLQLLRGRLAKEICLTAFGCLPVRIATLLGLQHKAAPLVSVQSPEALGAVAIVLKHAPFEHIVILRVIGLAAMRRGHAQERAQAVHEALGVCQFGPAGDRPFGDELFDGYMPLRAGVYRHTSATPGHGIGHIPYNSLPRTCAFCRHAMFSACHP